MSVQSKQFNFLFFYYSLIFVCEHIVRVTLATMRREVESLKHNVRPGVSIGNNVRYVLDVLTQHRKKEYF